MAAPNMERGVAAGRRGGAAAAGGRAGRESSPAGARAAKLSVRRGGADDGLMIRRDRALSRTVSSSEAAGVPNRARAAPAGAGIIAEPPPRYGDAGVVANLQRRGNAFPEEKHSDGGAGAAATAATAVDGGRARKPGEAGGGRGVCSALWPVLVGSLLATSRWSYHLLDS